MKKTLIIGLCLLVLSNCASAPRYTSDRKPPTRTKKVQRPQRQPPRKSTTARAKVRIGQVIVGISSFYGPDFHGKLTANGEVYDMYGRTAAHKTLPLNTIVRVTNLSNGRSIIVRINDRGPYVAGRILDLSYGAAKKLGFLNQGTTKVKIEIIEVGDNEYIHHLPNH
ncbi:MAG: septal ring lytic transglycosylase RlpA family protein [Candidatus Marinimicrobia bacterium]|nr:septal ring lytic transglycosylase RlpA family protein [Candidatus Neomarinimicrobiota bacterium]